MPNPQEIEVKFLINDLKRIERTIQAFGAQIIQPRVKEMNLRFDTPDGSLTREFRVLRLRQDEKARLTYKSPAASGLDVSSRQEIEFEVSNFDLARLFLEALGYQISFIYEKYRTTYRLGNGNIMLDEMPFGNFIEIEGPDAGAIRSMADSLQLDWEARCLASYMMLFNRLKKSPRHGFQNLTFEDFQGTSITAADLDLAPADETPPSSVAEAG